MFVKERFSLQVTLHRNKIDLESVKGLMNIM